jgi:hypothetical protein
MRLPKASSHLAWFASALLLTANVALAQERANDPVFRVVQRSRYETLNDQPRTGFSSNDNVLALQTSLFINVGTGRVRFSGEIMDARHELNDEGSQVNTTMVNALEPMQAYALISFPDLFQDGSTSTLKAGRFTMDVGRRRFVARSGFRNSINSFAGIDWQWRGKDGQTARAFVVDPMRILPTSRDELVDNEFELDRGNRDTHFAGLFYQFKPLPGRDRLELYWYGLDQGDRPNNDALPRDIDSAGFRVFRPSAKGMWSYEIETLWQTGTSSATAAGVTRRDLDHDAEFYHWEFGYAFDAKWSPALLLQFDSASGDEDPFDGRNEGFDTFYGERRFDFAPQGLWGLFARGNLRTPGVRMTFAPKPRWQAMLSARKFELESATDAWSGVGLRDVTGQAGSSIGRQLESSFIWTAIRDRLTVETGFAHLWAGRFLRETSQPFRGDPAYFYAVLTTSF